VLIFFFFEIFQGQQSVYFDFIHLKSKKKEIISIVRGFRAPSFFKPTNGENGGNSEV
jgi:hypothetical protein